MSNLKIFTSNIEDTAREQLNTLIGLEPFQESKIRIMPDVHAGAGCVIGFTANLGDKVIPNIVGVDIGCGMRVINLGHIDLDYSKLDTIIKKFVPAGFNVHNSQRTYDLSELYCFNELHNVSRIKCSLGTLGGGNHFIEIDEDKIGNKYLVIHTGSRNLGKQVAEIYQKKAIFYCSAKNQAQAEIQEKIAELKATGRSAEIQSAIIEIKHRYEVLNSLPKELCYLEGQDRLDYLHDMKICQEFAVENRSRIGTIICKKLGVEPIEVFETIHNYISFEDNIVRKGAISARKGEKVIIPMNMRDGCLLAIGKGNEDWNCSAPHGAGRTMSRSAARKTIQLEDFENSMEGIFTTTVNESTIDESPFAYKPTQEILDNIKDTVEVIDVIKPVYNFKASE